MFKKILYPTKFEEFALPILKNLTCLKAGGLEEVILVNVIETESLLIIRDSGLPIDFDRIRNSAQRKMSTYAEYIKAEGIAVRTKIVEGSMVPEILKAADEEDVSLIVAGRQKRDILGELFVGSTTDRIIRKSAVPVLVAKYHVLKETAGETTEQYCTNMFRKILYPTDWSSSAERAKKYIPVLRKVGASEIIVVHVLEPDFDLGIKEKLGALEQEFQSQGFTVSVQLLKGKPYMEINRIATEEDVSLIVMGSHGKGFMEVVFWGSVSQRVVEYSEKPVLVVK
jgi:nucleotide-binding universal stress UspA family protein